VAAGVGMTLLPELAVRPPVPPSPDVAVRRFAEPAPSRQISLCWRRTSVHRELLSRIGALVRDRLADLGIAGVRPVAG